MTYKASRKENKEVKFINTLDIIPEQGQLYTIDGRQYHTFNRKSWIGDTCASCFITFDDTSMYNLKKIDEQIVDIHWNVAATKLGKILGQVKQVDSAETTVEMYPVKYCPQAWEILFSIAAALSTSSKLQSNDAYNIQLAQSNGTM